VSLGLLDKKISDFTLLVLPWITASWVGDYDGMPSHRKTYSLQYAALLQHKVVDINHVENTTGQRGT